MVDSACNSGPLDNGFVFDKKSTLCTGTVYGYTATQGTGKASSCVVVIVQGSATGYVDVPSDSEQVSVPTVAQQLAAIAFETEQSSFKSYLSGVLTASRGTKHSVRLHSRREVRERTGPAVADQSEGCVDTDTSFHPHAHTLNKCSICSHLVFLTGHAHTSSLFQRIRVGSSRLQNSARTKPTDTTQQANNRDQRRRRKKAPPPNREEDEEQHHSKERRVENVAGSKNQNSTTKRLQHQTSFGIFPRFRSPGFFSGRRKSFLCFICF